MIGTGADPPVGVGAQVGTRMAPGLGHIGLAPKYYKCINGKKEIVFLLHSYIPVTYHNESDNALGYSL